MDLGKLFASIVKAAPKVKYYAALAIHVVDMLDGVQDWQLSNKPDAKAPKVRK